MASIVAGWVMISTMLFVAASQPARGLLAHPVHLLRRGGQSRQGARVRVDRNGKGENEGRSESMTLG